MIDNLPTFDRVQSERGTLVKRERRQAIIDIVSTATGLTETELLGRGAFNVFLEEALSLKEHRLAPNFELGTVLVKIHNDGTLEMRLDWCTEKLRMLEKKYPTFGTHPTYVAHSFRLPEK
jgi:hypothetical protein